MSKCLLTIVRNCFLVFLVCSVFSCKKQPNCSKGNAEIETNSPVVAGWPLYLSTFESVEYLYEWSGPNGFHINYEVFSTSANRQGKLETSLADSGIYTVKIQNREGCIEYEGSVNVSILPSPEPPCDIPTNTSVSNVLGVGGVTYLDTTLRKSDLEYELTSYVLRRPALSPEFLTIRFSKTPKPGIYMSNGNFASLSDEDVSIFIGSGQYDFVMRAGSQVYVTKNTTGMYISFCNAEFTNPLGQTPIRISAKIKG